MKSEQTLSDEILFDEMLKRVRDLNLCKSGKVAIEFELKSKHDRLHASCKVDFMSSSPCSSKSSTPKRSRNFLTKSRQDEDLCATIDVPIIDRSQIDDLNSTRLGEGTYGHVIKCRFRPTPDSLWENIAIKYGTDPSHAENLIREAKVILTHISHPNCIKIFGFYECPKNGMGVAMELMDCNLAFRLVR
ncbi:hypothetical protein OSTOST_02802 [Ostertagia ostertagi]